MPDPAPLTIVDHDEDAGLCIDCNGNVGQGSSGDFDHPEKMVVTFDA